MFFFERFLTLRYLRRAEGQKEGRGFLRFILYIAVGGVTVGVAALLLALSIVRGFSLEIESKITGIGSHIQVESIRDAPLAEAGRIGAVIADRADVVSVTPVIQEFALLRRSSREIDGVAITGVPSVPPFLADHLVGGTSALSKPSPDVLPRMLLGSALQSSLGISLGDRVTVFSVRTKEDGLLGSRPRIKQFEVSGVYETHLGQYDEVYVYVDIDEARELLEYGPDEVSRFDIALADVRQAREVSMDIEDELGFPVFARSIYELFSSLFAWVGLQQGIIPLVIAMIVIVAAFNIIGILLMIILEKTGEIGILSSMGASVTQIRRLFMSIGLAIGIVGSVLGSALALGLGLLQKRFDLIPLPAESYYMSTAPIALNVFDFVLVPAVALLLCLIAAYIPARVAGSIEPVRVIRFR